MNYLIALVIFLFGSTPGVFAQTNAATAAAEKQSSAAAETKDIRDLKTKLEEKVAQLQQTNKKAISGVVSSLSKNSIRITSADSTQYTVKIDEVLTKLFSINGTVKKEVKIDDYSKGDYIIAAGPQTDNTVNANYIYRDQQYIVGTGKIVEVDSGNFLIKIVNSAKETLTIDIQTKTTQLLFDSKTNETEKVGFSKIKEGDTIHYVLIKKGTEKEANRYDALRTLIIPQEFFIK